MVPLGRVEIYRKVESGPGSGQQIQKALALHREVQQELSIKGIRLVNQSKAILARHRDTGQSKVYMETADVDRWIILDDPHALQIEYGHDGYMQMRTDAKGHPYLVPVGPSEGLRVLRGPAGLK